VAARRLSQDDHALTSRRRPVLARRRATMVVTATGITLRPLVDDDAEVCARMMVSSDPWRTLGRTVDQALAVLRDPRKETIVAERDGAAAGFLILDLNGPFPGYIQTVCVDAAQRNLGIGARLVAAAEERIFSVSPNAFLCVSTFNPDARRLYERLGYAAVGVLDAYLVPEHGEVLMRKTRGTWTAFRERQAARAEPLPPLRTSFKRLGWVALAIVLSLWTNLATGWWISDAGSISAAVDHFVAISHADWMVQMVIVQTGIFTIIAIGWWVRDMGRLGWRWRRRLLWILGLAIFGVSAILAWFAVDRRRAERREA
jgi:[ribosomal protein S18]-alanine N-acetyltransferase